MFIPGSGLSLQFAAKKRAGTQSTKSAPSHKTKASGSIAFKIYDYDSTVGNLTYLLKQEHDKQKREEPLGWTALDQNGHAKEKLTDDFIALWNIIDTLLNKTAPAPYEQGILNLACFLLLNEETRLNTETGPFLLKVEKESGKSLGDLNREPLSKVLTQVFRPEITVMGGQPLYLVNAVLKPPTSKQLQQLRADMEARIQAGSQHRAEQMKQYNEIQEKKQEKARQAAEAEKRKQAEAEKRYRKESGLAAIADLHTRRTEAAEKKKPPSTSQRMKALQKEIKEINKLLEAGKVRLSPEETHRLQTEAHEKRVLIEKLENPPRVEFEIQHPQAAIKLLNSGIDKFRNQQIKSAELKYAQDSDHPLQEHNNAGFYDERIALWQTVTHLLQKATPSAEEESAIDLGLFLLVNKLNVTENWQGIEFKTLWPKHMDDILSGDPETLAQYSEMNLAYPKEDNWRNVIHWMNDKISYHQEHKARQEKTIKNKRWANSPDGKAEIRRRDAEQSEFFERLEREEQERRRQQEIDNWKKDRNQMLELEWPLS